MKRLALSLIVLALAAPAFAQSGLAIGNSTKTQKPPTLVEARECASATGYWVVMRRALEYAGTFDIPVIQHAEDHALTEGGSEIWVPARNQWLDTPARLLPRALRERIFALTGADKVLAEADPDTRQSYEGRHSGGS